MHNPLIPSPDDHDEPDYDDDDSYGDLRYAEACAADVRAAATSPEEVAMGPGTMTCSV